MALTPDAVPFDSTNSREHRGKIAVAVNELLKRVFKPNPISAQAVATDASVVVRCYGNPVLILGFANVAAGGASFNLKRDGVTIETIGNMTAAKNMPIAWLDNPGLGNFTYTTDSGGFTNSASLKAVELK